MCGRYQFTKEQLDEINQIIHELDSKAITYKTGEIFPTDTAPIIQRQNEYAAMKWGFPKWDNKGVIINARSETAHKKSMFSKSLLERRCVIPTTGFLEWQKKDSTKPKDKFLFQLNDSPILYLAGIYNTFGDKDCFVILTRNANASISDIHDRMPVVLYKKEIEDWLYDNKFIDFVMNRDNVILTRY